MKLSVHYSEGWNARDLPWPSSSWKPFLALFVRRLKGTPDWQETERLLGESLQSMSILFCGDAEMREYQREYRHLDRTTDVLSFPTRELIPTVGSAPSYEGHLGDLIVSLEAVRRAARRVRRPFALELSEVVIHGGLHLLGWDHVGSSALARQRARLMKTLQRELSREAQRFIKTRDVRVRSS